MEKILWEVQYISPPLAIRYCKKCGQKREYGCSGLFRVNAQKKHLDIWLIYKCSDCDATWNATVYSRISPQSLEPQILEGFYKNDKELAHRYAMDTGFLRRNGVESGTADYRILGDSLPQNRPCQLSIISQYPLPLKVSSILRKKLQLSQKDFLQLLEQEKIKGMPGIDLKRCKLQQNVILTVEDFTPHG